MNFTKDYMDIGGSVYFYNRVDKLPRTKENAFLHGLAMFCRSWTFERLTEDEKINCVDSFLFALEQGMIKGTFHDRMQTMNAIYNAFLNGVGRSRFA